jgi:hypothetical protein
LIKTTGPISSSICFEIVTCSSISTNLAMPR